VEVDPIKPTLKAPGTKCLKLNYDGLLSSFAFKFNLRRYITESVKINIANRTCEMTLSLRLGGAVQVASIKTRVENTPVFSA
jgi:hypothetical protein